MTNYDRAVFLPRSIVDAAVELGLRDGRSGSQQLELWARVGRSLTEQPPSIMGRVEKALAGELSPDGLSPLESVIFDAEVEARMAVRVSEVNYAVKRAQYGLSSVALDDSGELIEYLPDGAK